MYLRNPFPIETRWLFFDVRYKCFDCGSNQGVELHHILGRVSSSAFNACPLCKDCHVKVKHNQEEHQRLFLKTLQYLITIGYNPSEEDYLFINNNFQNINSVNLQQFLHNERG